jgi:DNA-binding CsgD family transcriptional regulator
VGRLGQNGIARVELSTRERDCLRWTAEGKSSWGIGMILNISENTVSFHIKNAMRKLGTTSRTVAVIKAIRLNLIELPGRLRGAWRRSFPGATALRSANSSHID